MPNGLPRRRDASCATAKLTSTVVFESRTFNRFGYNVKGLTTHQTQVHVFYNTWARYTYGNSTITLRLHSQAPVKWIILYRITENNELSTTRASLSLVSSAVFLTIIPISRTASMLILFLVELNSTPSYIRYLFANSRNRINQDYGQLLTPFVTGRVTTDKVNTYCFAARSISFCNWYIDAKSLPPATRR